jgi:hypothetical protein
MWIRTFYLSFLASLEHRRTGFSMLTRTEGFLTSKSANQMRTNQSAIFEVCLSRSDWVGDRYLSEFYWQCKQFTRNFGSVYFARERWEEMFLECFLDRDEKIVISGIKRCKTAFRVANVPGVPRMSIDCIFRLLGRSLIDVSQLNILSLTNSSSCCFFAQERKILNLVRSVYAGAIVGEHNRPLRPQDSHFAEFRHDPLGHTMCILITNHLPTQQNVASMIAHPKTY